MSFSFTKNGVKHEPINYWELEDGNTILIYQGSRGANPDLDFILKYKAPNKRLRAPSHTHWIVDMIAKSQLSPEDIRQFISEWVDLYDKIEPFKTTDERDNYRLIYTEYFKEVYSPLEYLGYYSIEFLSVLLELFIKCEKQTPNAFMFKNLLILFQDFCDGKKDFYQLVSHSKRV